MPQIKFPGGEGNDRLFGGSTADSLLGGPGADTLVGNGGNGGNGGDDVPDGQPGFDMLDHTDDSRAAVSQAMARVTETLRRRPSAAAPST